MQRKINTGFAISIIIILAIFFGGIFWMMEEKNIADAPETQSQATQTIPQATNVAEKQTEQKNLQSSIDVSGWKIYKNEKYGFEFKYPQTWFEQKPIDGLMAFNVYFTSKDIANDYNKLGKDDVQFSVMKSKDETQINNDEPLRVLDTIKGVVISGKTPVTIDGNDGIMQLQDSSVSDPGCNLVSYFKKNGVSHQIQMNTVGLHNCETVKKYSGVYDAILSSFIVK